MAHPGFSHRPVAYGHHGLVAAAHPAAALAGVDALRAGGTAADAAVAVNAVLAVTQPHMCGIGGDLFALYFDPVTRTVACLEGAGRAGARASADALRARGLSTLPVTGALPVTVPGCVGAWALLVARFGRRSLGDALAPAVALAAEGFPVTSLLAQTIRERGPALDDAEWHRIYAPGGRPPAAGERLRQPDLGRTLAALGRDGAEGFYGGEVGGRIATAVAEGGGFLTVADVATPGVRWGAPLATTYRDATVHQLPPPSQGLTLLQALNLVEDWDFAVPGAPSAASLHRMVEALKLAYADRDRYLGDPDHVTVPVAALLDKAYARRQRARIDPRRAAPAPVAGDLAGDTTGFVVAAPDGSVAVVIQSLFAGFGAGVVPPGTGVVLHNRGAAFSLDPVSPNVLAPGRRPAHTLIATLACRAGRPVAALAAMGGHAQPQTHVQVLSHLLDLGLDPQEAIERPRLVQGRMRATDPPDRLRVEQGISARVVAGLRRRGHPVDVVPDRSWTMGHAHAVTLAEGPGGTCLAGGADPRGDGLALGY